MSEVAEPTALDLQKTAEWYQRFHDVETPGQSEIYADWSAGVAGDAQVVRLISGLPRPKRQPNLVFACSRLLGAPEGPYAAYRDWLVANWPAVAAEALVRSTQTNEPRRLTAIVPLLARLPGPLALIEVGASAGLCLYPDRYSYAFGETSVHPADGPSAVVLATEISGPVPIPSQSPSIAWRAGIDLNPLDVHDIDDRAWLRTLVWPEQRARRARMDAAIDIVSADPPHIVRGDAVHALAALAAEAPAGVPLVVVSPAVLVYLSAEERRAFVDLVTGLEATWISLDAVGVLPDVDARLDPPPVPGDFLVSLDGVPVARCGPHGQTLDWF